MAETSQERRARLRAERVPRTPEQHAQIKADIASSVQSRKERQAQRIQETHESGVANADRRRTLLNGGQFGA